MNELITQAQMGNRTAFGELAKRFDKMVYATVLARLGNPTEAQDLTQDVFVHVMTKISQLRNPRCFAGWLRQIAARMAINHIRIMLRYKPQPGRDRPYDNSPLNQLVRSETKTRLWDSLKKLKPLDRNTLIAFYIQGHSLKRMAKDFNSPLGTIKRRLHVARKRLKFTLAKV